MKATNLLGSLLGEVGTANLLKDALHDVNILLGGNSLLVEAEAILNLLLHHLTKLGGGSI